MVDPKDTTVLLVDDDPDFMLQQEVQLTREGFRVVTANNRQEAEAMLDSACPDIAVVDLMMEEPDAGFAFCYHLKRKAPDTPIILVSGVTRETGIEFGAATPEERSWVRADAFLAKPVRFEQLKREMERLLKD